MPGKHPALGRRNGHRRYGVNRRHAANRCGARWAAVPLSLGAMTSQPHATSRCGTRGATGFSGWIRTILSAGVRPAASRAWSTAMPIGAVLGHVIQVHCPGGGENGDPDDRCDGGRPCQAHSQPAGFTVRGAGSRADPDCDPPRRRHGRLDRSVRRARRLGPEFRKLRERKPPRDLRPPASRTSASGRTTLLRSLAWA